MSSGTSPRVRYLLFSECLQNDFVAPINAGAPLPNELHIGRAESRRLLGDPEGAWTEEGPLARFLSAFRTGAGPDHASVHIRDWHDPENPATRTHLEYFGSHCVRGTRGAEFVGPLAPVVDAGGLVVDSEVFSDFVGTTLEQMSHLYCRVQRLSVGARRRRRARGDFVRPLGSFDVDSSGGFSSHYGCRRAHTGRPDPEARLSRAWVSKSLGHLRRQ